jgi:hypothetical protein
MWEAADVVAGRSAGGGLWQFFYCLYNFFAVRQTYTAKECTFFF